MGRVGLGDSWRPQLPSRSVGAALFSPFNLPLVVLPLDQGFALGWWLPFVACLLGVYGWLRSMRVEQGVALLASLLVTTAPAMVWWTGVGSQLAQIIAAATVPSALVIGATRIRDRKPRLSMVAAVLGGLAAASLPWFYAPWVVPIALFVGGVTCIWGFSEPEHRRSFLVMAGLAVGVFVAEELVYLLHERSYYEALGSTVYPGARRVGGGGVGIAPLYSSLFPLTLASSRGARLITTNLSEISMGWTAAAPCAIGLLLLGRGALKRGERFLVSGAVLLMLTLSSWCFVAWPKPLAALTFFDRISPSRVAPLIGFFGVICLALLLGTADRRDRLARRLGARGGAVVTAFVVLVAAWGATSFRRQFLPVLSQARVSLALAGLAIVTAALFTRFRGIVLGAATTAAVASGLVVNPLSLGTGALDHSSPAVTVRRIDARVVAPSNGEWAAEGLYLQGLLNGEGVNSLSSFNDPVDRRAWRILDPRSRYENAWNRTAYISFVWRSGFEAPVITNTQADIVQVAVDPCDARLARLRLRAIVSSQPLESACLRQLAEFAWMGTPSFVYERVTAPGARA